jgi:hypothetical protein
MNDYFALYAAQVQQHTANVQSLLEAVKALPDCEMAVNKVNEARHCINSDLNVNDDCQRISTSNATTASDNEQPYVICIRFYFHLFAVCWQSLCQLRNIHTPAMSIHVMLARYAVLFLYSYIF